MTKTSNNRASKTVKASTGKQGARHLILQVLAEAHAMGKGSVSRDRLPVSTGLAAKTITNNIAKMKQEGIIVCPDSKTLQLTTAGIEKAGSLATLPQTNQDRHDRLLQKLKNKQVALIKELLDGAIHDKEQVARDLGYTSDGKKTKGFVNLVGAVRGLGFVEYPDKNSVQLTDVWFPCGRP